MPYGINAKTAEETIHTSAHIIDVFETQGSRNFLESRDFYKVAGSGLGIASALVSGSVGLGMIIAASLFTGHVSEKKVSSWKGLTKDRDGIRRGEVDALLKEMYDLYMKETEKFIQEVVNRIETDAQTRSLKRCLDGNARLEDFADRLCGIAESSNAALNRKYAS